jgi:hypothetical protein
MPSDPLVLQLKITYYADADEFVMVSKDGKPPIRIGNNARSEAEPPGGYAVLKAFVARDDDTT